MDWTLFLSVTLSTIEAEILLKSYVANSTMQYIIYTNINMLPKVSSSKMNVQLL